MAIIDIKELFRKAFGYEAPQNFSIEKAPARLEHSSLGAPYYATDVYGREFFLPVRLDGYLLPFAVISLAAKKMIIETPLPERYGSVIEMISVENLVINIKGVLLSDDNYFPEKEVKELNEIFEKNESIVLSSVLTDIFLKGGTYEQSTKKHLQFDQKVVIKSLQFPAIAGVENAKSFEMELMSDMSYDLEEK